MSVDSLRSIQENYVKYADMFENKSNDTISIETFYKLLMAEMSNQDPMEPMSNTEFISQMASFTALKSQQDALYYNNANYAQSLVGKTVTVAKITGKSANDVTSKSGIVTSMSLQNGEFQVKVNGENYALSSIMEVLPSSNPFAVTGDDGAFATSLIGKQVTVESTNSEGKVIYETGVVSHIEIKDSEVSVVINDLSYPVASVLKVEEKPVDAPAETSDDTILTSAELSSLSSASALIGKTVSVSVKIEANENKANEEDEYDEYEETEYIVSGVVNRVQVDNGKVYLIINDEAYLMSSIVSVENTNEKVTDDVQNDETDNETQNSGTTDGTQNSGTTDGTQNNGTTEGTQNNGTTEGTQNNGTTEGTQNNGTTDGTQNSGTTEGTQNNEETLTPQHDDTEELESLFA